VKEENDKREAVDFSYFETKETKEFSEKLKTHGNKATEVMKNFVSKMGTEAKETHEASKIVVKFLKEGKVSKEEEHELKTQIYDLFKMAGIGIPFMLIPGSTLLMPFLIKLANKIGIDLLPSAFKKEEQNTLDNLEK
tara:strand:- start:50 stop:460 length:411 start_codon:yes stop_codon:yes gene_type:complete